MVQRTYVLTFSAPPSPQLVRRSMNFYDLKATEGATDLHGYSLSFLRPAREIFLLVKTQIIQKTESTTSKYPQDTFAIPTSQSSHQHKYRETDRARSYVLLQTYRIPIFNVRRGKLPMGIARQQRCVGRKRETSVREREGESEKQQTGDDGSVMIYQVRRYRRSSPPGTRG